MGNTVVQKFFNRKYFIDKKIQGKIFSLMHDFLEIFFFLFFFFSNVFQLMRMKVCINYSTRNLLASYKVCLCFFIVI